MTSASRSRPYRKIERARQEEETRRRITEAAVELHGTLGPAQTTITDLAKRAGVSRMTVYNHFPTEVDLFLACSSHWAARNPFPDPSRWSGLEDPPERLFTALKEFFSFYREKEGMLGRVFRDAPSLPALQEVMQYLWSPYVEAVVDTLAQGWRVHESDRQALRAALRLVIGFDSWRLLAASLDDEGAALIATRLVAGAFGAQVSVPGSFPASTPAGSSPDS